MSYNPEWEKKEFVFLDRKWKEIEWVYINPNANDAPQFVSEICSFNDFCSCVYDALKGPGDFFEYYEANHKEYLKDRHSKFFDDMCDFIGSDKPDFVFDTQYLDRYRSVMAVFAEVYRLIKEVYDD